MPPLARYQPFAAEFQNVNQRIIAILTEPNAAFTGRLKAEKLANAHRYFSKVMTSLQQFCINEDVSGYKSDDAEIDSNLLSA
jgi:hypothetical protein